LKSVLVIRVTISASCVLYLTNLSGVVLMYIQETLTNTFRNSRTKLNSQLFFPLRMLKKQELSWRWCCWKLTSSKN